MQTLYFDLRDTKGPQKGVEEKISAAYRDSFAQTAAELRELSAQMVAAHE